ncbi:MAG: imidazole glycerol phosphate synthase subunit HisF, partial [Candidatus Aminicenantes bacterium]|nr:imidazole glycerol phosphate synthase subunit HisF [Candidatus Aminicenantes bacterium]
GICLGMQLLFEDSEEDGGRNPGLGIFRGRVGRLDGPRLLHVGWNAAATTAPDGPVEPGFYYFIHGYAPRPENPSDILAESRFGETVFPAAVGRDRVTGVQFHPEKSGQAGLAFLDGWANNKERLPKEAGSSPSTGKSGPPRATPAVRLIPCLDMDDGRVVKGVRFENLRDAGDPAELARRYVEQGADEICFLDVGATWKSRRTLLEIVARVAGETFIPLTVGGGLRTVEDIREALQAGADKVSLGTAALENPELLQEAAERFGRQCLVVSIDARAKNGGWVATTHGGRRESGRDAVGWAGTAEAAGAGEILLNSIDRDGTGSGYDLDLLGRVRTAVRIPVIASGGGETPAQTWEAVVHGGADAVLLASVLHGGRRTISEFKTFLRKKGVFVR